MSTKATMMVIGALVLALSGTLSAVQNDGSLGSVRLSRNVLADGQPLPAGTYTVRVSNDPVEPVVGLSAGSARWVEFVQAGAVKGRELASVVAPEDVEAVAKMAPPAPGTARVQMLQGAEYLRIWLNQAGTQYLVHLSTSPN